MLGIVLWSSPVRRQAVVWCEDHGPLAYLSDPRSAKIPDSWPGAGETVDVITQRRGGVREIAAVKLLGGRLDLAQRLRLAVAAQPAADLASETEPDPEPEPAGPLLAEAG